MAVVGQSGPPQQGRGQTTPKTPAHASMPVASGSSRPPQQNPGKGSRREPKRQNVQNAQDASQKSPAEIKNATPVPTNSVDINVNVRNDPPANAQTDMSRNFGSFQNDWQGKGKGGGQQSDNRWHGKGAFQYPPRNVEYGAFSSRQEQLGKGKGRGGKKVAMVTSSHVKPHIMRNTATLVKKVVGKDSKANLTPHAAWRNSQTTNRLGGPRSEPRVRAHFWRDTTCQEIFFFAGAEWGWWESNWGAF